MGRTADASGELIAAGSAIHAYQVFIRVRQRKLVHAPRLVLRRSRGSKNLIRKACGVFVDIGRVEIESEGTLVRHQPAFHGLGQVEMAAFAVGQDAVARIRLARLMKPQPRVESL